MIVGRCNCGIHTRMGDGGGAALGDGDLRATSGDVQGYSGDLRTTSGDVHGAMGVRSGDLMAGIEDVQEHSVETRVGR